MTPSTAGPRPLCLRYYALGAILAVCDEARRRAVVEAPEAFLRARHWRPQGWAWVSPGGLHRAFEAAIAHELRGELRRWLAWDCGWRVLPTGEPIRYATTAGLVAAARAERELVRLPEVLA